MNTYISLQEAGISKHSQKKIMQFLWHCFGQLLHIYYVEHLIEHDIDIACRVCIH